MAKKAPALPVAPSTSVFVRLEAWLEKKDRWILYLLAGLSLLFSFLLFNVKISEAQDDANYVESGWRYVHEFPHFFYTANAPLYPMFLGGMTGLFGTHLILFKLLSVTFNLIALFLFYKALVRRVPYLVLVPVLVFISINHLIQYYASMTYTEAAFFALQAAFFYRFAKLHDQLKQNSELQSTWPLWLSVGLFIFLLSILKSVTMVLLPTLMLFFLLQKQWKNAVLALASYAIYKLPYEGLLRLIWPNAHNQFTSQSQILLLKNPYDTTAGNEELMGFVERFFNNCHLYLGRRFFQILGFQSERSEALHSIGAILLVIAALAGLYIVIRRNNTLLFFFGLYTAALLLLSFIILQTSWDQPRIVLIGMPVMLLLIFTTLYTFAEKNRIGQWGYLVLIFFFCSSLLLSSSKRSIRNYPVLKKNLAGDLYYGYTPDWQNFLKCSQWCKDHLPETALVASRKAPMSFIYADGKKFFPVYNVLYRDPSTGLSNPDSTLAFFKREKVTHVLLANLRVYAEVKTKEVITTMHYIVRPIAEKYPNTFKLVHEEGSDEKAYVFEIIY